MNKVPFIRHWSVFIISTSELLNGYYKWEPSFVRSCKDYVERFCFFLHKILLIAVGVELLQQLRYETDIIYIYTE